MPHVAARVLTCLLPLGVGLGAWVAVSGTIDPEPHAIARRLRAARPEVIVLGSSVAQRDIDRDELAAALNLPADSVMMAAIPASTGAHWAAVLHHVVYAREGGPKVVVIADALASLLTPDVEGHEERLRLAEVLRGRAPAFDAVLGEKAFGGPYGLEAERLRLAVRELRRTWVGGVPDLVIGLLWGARSSPQAGGRQIVVEATDRVFRPEHMEGETRRGLPEMFRPPEPERAWRLPTSPEGSFLPEMLQAVRAHGARLVFARMPFPPSFPEVDRLPPALEHQAAAYLVAEGAGYVDLRSLGLTDADFSDRDHATPEGAARISRAVAEALLDDARTSWVPPLAEAHGIASPLPAPAAVAATPQGPLAPGVPAILGPGASLTFTLDADWPEGSELTLRGEKLTHGGGLHLSWGAATVSVDGSPRLSARLPRNVGPVRVDVPHDGAWVRIDSLAAGVPARMAWLVGDDVDARPPALRLAGGRVVDHRVVPTFPSPPPPLPDAAPIARGRGQAAFALPALGALADAPSSPAGLDRLKEGAQAGNDYLADVCSPVRVLEDGVPLAWPNTFCAHVRQLGHGRTCHVGDELMFSASDGSDPTTNGRHYTLALAHDRRCALAIQRGRGALYDAIWLYPEDLGRWLAPPDRRDRLPTDATAIHIGASLILGPPESELVVRAQGVERRARASLHTTVLDWPVPLPADTIVEVVSGPEAYWRVRSLALVGE